MAARKYEYMSDFERKYLGDGKAEGRAEGKAEGEAAILIMLLSQRFGALSEVLQYRIRGASIPKLESLAQRVLSASTLSEALGELGWPSVDHQASAAIPNCLKPLLGPEPDTHTKMVRLCVLLELWKRFGDLPQVTQDWISRASEPELNAVWRTLKTASTLSEALGELGEGGT
jgi:hypothetical protein